MNLRSPKQIITNLYTKHAEKLDNVIYADKLFVVNSVICYLFKDKDIHRVDKVKVLEYGELINRFLDDEIDIYWRDGILMVRELDLDGQVRGG